MCVHSLSSHFPSCLSCHFLLSDLRSLALALDSEALVGTSLLITLRNIFYIKDIRHTYMVNCACGTLTFCMFSNYLHVHACTHLSYALPPPY